jgi:hypothetical protein
MGERKITKCLSEKPGMITWILCKDKTILTFMLKNVCSSELHPDG